MRTLIVAGVFLISSNFILCRPPRKDANANQIPHEPENKAAGANGTQEWDLNLDYNRYLQEIVQVLESDPDFRKKLESADVEKIRDGTIAEELDFVHHGIRNKLDDIKRKELDRLRHLAMKQYELSEGIDRKHMKIPNHLEIQNPSFEKEDLIKLIRTTTKDLEEADRNRRGEFKKYEMEKKFEQDERLKHIEDEAKRKEEEARINEMEAKHKQHEKPHHPMTKDQLEEVWEEQDHMKAEDWDPKTFFMMHDLNGDGQWDEDEIKTLFQKELDKVYDPNAKEDDMVERREEMERMREHVFKESDKNKDRLISYEEFLDETKREEFNNDPGWDTLDSDDEEPFTDEEFRAYEMQRQREIQDMINKGLVPPNYPYYGDVPPGAQPYHLPQQGGGVGSVPGQPAYHPPEQFQQHQQIGSQPDHAQFQQQQLQGQPGQPQGHPDQFQGQPGQPQGHPSQFQGQPGQPQGHPSQFQGQPGQPQGHPSQFQGQPGQPQGHPAQFQGQPGQPQGHPSQFQGQPGQPQAHPSQFQGQAGQPHPSHLQGQPGQPQGHPGQPQGHPAQFQGQPGQPMGQSGQPQFQPPPPQQQQHQGQQQFQQPPPQGQRIQPGELSRQHQEMKQQQPNSNQQQHP